MPHMDLAQLLADHITGLLQRDHRLPEQHGCQAVLTEMVVGKAIEVMRAHGYTTSEAVAIGDRATEQVRASLVAKDIRRILPEIELVKDDTAQIDGLEEASKLETVNTDDDFSELDQPLRHENKFPKSHLCRRLRDLVLAQEDCTEEVLAAAHRITSHNY